MKIKNRVNVMVVTQSDMIPSQRSPEDNYATLLIKGSKEPVESADLILMSDGFGRLLVLKDRHGLFSEA